MPANSESLTERVKKHYGLEPVSWGEEETFDATNLTILHTDNSETTTNKGTFTVRNFVDKDGNNYKLVQYTGNFPEEEELITYLQDGEYGAVKEWLYINATKPWKNHFLYKLIPYTVNGGAIW